MIVVLVLLSTELPTLAPRADAQSGGAYDLTWSTIDDGGGASTGGTYALIGTVGQPDVGATLSGGVYILAGGFWGSGGAPPQSPLYLPLILR
ncbi:MAG: hypothetical protein KGJ80_02350 [Chloroflexota bacterium]|nr:hypothetical protein [Chloroflexota bacterium]